MWKAQHDALATTLRERHNVISIETALNRVECTCLEGAGHLREEELQDRMVIMAAVIHHERMIMSRRLQGLEEEVIKLRSREQAVTHTVEMRAYYPQMSFD